MFQMSRTQWEANVARASAARQAKPFGTKDSGIGLATETPDGILIVRPIYTDNALRPGALQVSVGYRPGTAGSKRSDTDVGEILAAVKKQMSPEYSLIADFERISGGLTISFMIMEALRK